MYITISIPLNIFFVKTISVYYLLDFIIIIIFNLIFD